MYHGHVAPYVCSRDTRVSVGVCFCVTMPLSQRLGDWPRAQFGKHYPHLSGPQFLTCIMGSRIPPGPSQGCGDVMGNKVWTDCSIWTHFGNEREPQLLGCPFTQTHPRTCYLLPSNLSFSLGPSDLGLTWPPLKLMSMRDRGCPLPLSTAPSSPARPQAGTEGPFGCPTQPTTHARPSVPEGHPLEVAPLQSP